MDTPYLMMKNLYLQKEFSEQTENWLRVVYGLAEDEYPLCAMWTNPVIRRGFLITDEALRWSVAANDGEKAMGSLLKDVSPTADFSIMPTTEGLLRLELVADGKTDTFFIKGLAEEKGKTLCDILRFGYLQGEVPQADLGAFVKPMPFLAVRNFLDGDLVFFSSVADKILGIAKAEKQAVDKETPADEAQKESAETAATANATPDDAAEKADSADATDAQTKSAQPQTEQPQSASATTENQLQVEPVAQQSSFGEKLLRVLFALVDICASLVFIACIFIILKPELLQRFIDTDKVFSESVIEFLKRENTLFWRIGDFIRLVKDNYHTHLRNLQHGFVGVGLIVFFVLKILVFLTAKNNKQKIVSLLVVIISLFAVFLAVDRFALFIPFTLLAYLAFEYSCGFKTRGIIAKVIMVSLLSCGVYISWSIWAAPDALESYHAILNHLQTIKHALPPVRRIQWW